MSPRSCLGVLALPDTGAVPILRDEDHAGRFEGGADGCNGARMWRGLFSLETDNRSLGNVATDSGGQFILAPPN